MTNETPESPPRREFIRRLGGLLKRPDAEPHSPGALLDTEITRRIFLATVATFISAFLLSRKGRNLPESTPIPDSPVPPTPTPTLKDILTNQAPEEETVKALSTRFITDANNLLEQYAQSLLWTPERFGREREKMTQQAEQAASDGLKNDNWGKDRFSPWFLLGRNDNDTDLEFDAGLFYSKSQDRNTLEVRNVLYWQIAINLNNNMFFRKGIPNRIRDMLIGKVRDGKLWWDFRDNIDPQDVVNTFFKLPQDLKWLPPEKEDGPTRRTTTILKTAEPSYDMPLQVIVSTNTADITLKGVKFIDS